MIIDIQSNINSLEKYVDKIMGVHKLLTLLLYLLNILCLLVEGWVGFFNIKKVNITNSIIISFSILFLEEKG